MKHKINFSILRKNRGFAILFALGILSVVLIVVMLFASQAKVSSTIAAIHLENQSARTLAKSLVPRVIWTINKSPDVQDQILYSSIYDDGNVGLNTKHRSDSLYSYDWIWKLEHPAHIKFIPTEGDNSGQISKLGTFRYYMAPGANKAPEFDEMNPFVPTWQYILDIPSPKAEDEAEKAEDEGKTVSFAPRSRGVAARFAFVIIPKIAHLNPKAIADHTHCKKLSAKSFKDTNHGVCRKCARKPGNSPAELMFSTSLAADLYNRAEGNFISGGLHGAFGNGGTEESKTIFSDILAFGKEHGILKVPGLGASEAEVDTYINNRNTLTRFMDIDNAGDREAYWSDDGNPDETENGKPKGENDGVRDPREMYHRFNMRRTDWENLKIDDLVQKTKEWSELGEEEPAIGGSGNHDTGGIAWFRNWDDKGTWGSAEEKRNQILANLLNYCSPATRPVVSDVEPQNWKTNDPTYTGLKRTLYTNEYYYDLQFTADVSVAYNEANDTTDADVSYNIDTKLMVELVDMYLNTLGDENNNPAEFGKEREKPDFSAYKPEIYGTVSFEYMIPETGNWEEKSYSIKDDLEGFKRFEDTEKVTEIPENKKEYGYYGYYAGKTDELKFSYKDLPGNVTEAELYNKTKIRNVKVKIDKILLCRTPTTDEKKFLDAANKDNVSPEYKTFPVGLTDDKEYVDCSIISKGLKENEYTAAATGSLKDGDALWAVWGNGEVVDPRQNLRPKDWELKITAGPAARYNADKKKHTLPIQTYTTNASGGQIPNDVEPTNRVLTGQKSPKLKKSASSYRIHDCEAAEDPSWQLSAGKKMDPKRNNTHISTAFIRHAILREEQGDIVEYPMESLWELGAIHRAENWQTLNLSQSKEYTTAKNFVNEGGGDYKDGDAPLLDQVKMTNDCISFGKVNLVRHVDQEVRDTVIGSLFKDMPVQTVGYYGEFDDLGRAGGPKYPWVRIYDEAYPNPPGSTSPTVKAGNVSQWKYDSYVAALYDVLFGDFGNENPLQKASGGTGTNKFWRRTDFLAAPKTRHSDDVNDILYPIRQNYDDISDAMEEQIIGRTINLMKVDSTVKGATAILVVQTLKDSGDGVTIFKDWDSDGKIAGGKGKPEDSTIAHHQAGYRRFEDVDENTQSFFTPPKNHSEKVTGIKGIYQNGADTITGEAKVVITLDFNTETQKWEVVRYEYAD